MQQAVARQHIGTWGSAATRVRPDARPGGKRGRGSLPDFRLPAGPGKNARPVEGAVGFRWPQRRARRCHPGIGGAGRPVALASPAPAVLSLPWGAPSRPSGSASGKSGSRLPHSGGAVPLPCPLAHGGGHARRHFSRPVPARAVCAVFADAGTGDKSHLGSRLCRTTFRKDVRHVTGRAGGEGRDRGAACQFATRMSKWPTTHVPSQERVGRVASGRSAGRFSTAPPRAGCSWHGACVQTGQ
jgi:hypothetical protein